jgi:predicted transcriptional regulator
VSSSAGQAEAAAALEEEGAHRPAVPRALAHSVRVQVIRVVAERPGATPREIADKTGVDLRVTAYHVQFLAKMGCLRLTHLGEAGGAVSHEYTLEESFFPPGLLEIVCAQPSADTSEEDVVAAAVEDAALGKALRHPLRIEILAVMMENRLRAWSPVMLSHRLNVRLGTAAFHVKQLTDLGLLLSSKRTRPAGRRTEHFYEISERAAALLPVAFLIYGSNSADVA